MYKLKEIEVADLHKIRIDNKEKQQKENNLLLVI